jgi:hypothetical protein
MSSEKTRDLGVQAPQLHQPAAVGRAGVIESLGSAAMVNVYNARVTFGGNGYEVHR